MMTKTEIITQLTSELNNLSYRDTAQLEIFKDRLDETLKSLGDQTTDYRYQLKNTRFSPWTGHTDEGDFKKSWESGKTTLINILKNILEDSQIPIMVAATPDVVPVTETKIPEHPPTSNIVPSIEESKEVISNTTEVETIPQDETTSPLTEIVPPEKAKDLSVDEPQEENLPSVNDPQPEEIKEKQSVDIQTDGIVLPKEEIIPTVQLESPPRKQNKLAKFLSFFHSKPVEEENQPKLKKSSKISDSKENEPPVISTDPISSTDTKNTSNATPAEESSVTAEAPLPETKDPAIEKTVSKKSAPNRILLISSPETEMNKKVRGILEKAGMNILIFNRNDVLGKPFHTVLQETESFDFVLVLLSADGFYYLKDQKPQDARMVSRQNIIFQYGFLLGKLGRNKVAVIYNEKKNFELPSNFFDAYYIPYGPEKPWQNELNKFLKAQGILIS